MYDPLDEAGQEPAEPSRSQQIVDSILAIIMHGAAALGLLYVLIFIVGKWLYGQL